VVSPVIRIFVLCKSQRRIRELAATIQPSPAASYFRFTTFPLDAATVLTAEVWQDCEGKLYRIIRSDKP
jgi:hypothetical protein